MKSINVCNTHHVGETSVKSNSKGWSKHGLIEHLDRGTINLQKSDKKKGFQAFKGGKLWEGEYIGWRGEL